MSLRRDGRASNQMRPLKVTYGVYGNAHGSCLFEVGNTRVLCAVMIQDGVPPFLRGTGTGWLTAEYAMLPASTAMRTPREIALMKRNNRSVEISRLIGRALRAVVDLHALGEKTIYIDCDVLQADGGTRTASISGAYCALRQAAQRWVSEGVLKKSVLRDSVVAVSVGALNGQVLLDVDFSEDSQVDADFNFVMTGSGSLIELQGATEKNPISWDTVQAMHVVALKGISDILLVLDQTPLVAYTPASQPSTCCFSK